jgi:hypothetical protein
MSKSEEAAFASMREEILTPAEPEPAEDQAESEGAAPPPVEEGEAPEAEGEDDARSTPAPPPKFVRQEALREERERRQQLEADNRRMSEERARIDERLRIIEEMNRPAPAPEPDENVDPVATIGYLRREVAALKQGWQQNSQQWTEAQQQQAEIQQLDAATSYEVDQYKARVPDYTDAFQFWRQSRAGEMQAYGLHPAQIEAELIKEGRELARGAFQRGVSPPEMLYTIAKQRGYKAGNGNGRAGNGHDAAERQIERVATGQERNRTLSGTGGGAAPVQMTANLLAAMSEDEVADWTSKNAKATDRLMGKEAGRGRGR